jgi:hypothetical protein
VTDSTFVGLDATAWTAIVSVVTAAGVGVALFLGLRGLGQATRAAKAAEDQGKLLADQLQAQYPKLEVTLPLDARDIRTGRPFVVVRALSGDMAATNVEAWWYNGADWMRGGWPAVSPLQGEYRVLLDKVAGIALHETPFADFLAGKSVAFTGLIGVLWTRPDGRWRFVQELEDGGISGERAELGPVAQARLPQALGGQPR